MDNVRQIIDKYLAGECTAEERAKLLAHFNQYLDQQSDILSPEALTRLQELTWLSIREQTEQPVTNPIKNGKHRSLNKRRMLQWIPYAAAILLTAIVALWYLYSHPGSADPSGLTQVADIAPGGNRATLTLTNGSTINLSEAHEGIIIADDRISYKDHSQDIVQLDKSAIYDLVLSTPKGGTYQVTLPDGTKVWLNAASTLKYPSRFEGAERVVTFSGEGYFEVARDIHKPFRVTSEDQQVVVLGTEFNICAYPDEDTKKTTLVEGKVKVLYTNSRNSAHAVELAPSEQSLLGNEQLTKQWVDVTGEISWREGVFAFRKESLESIMRKISRWYNVDVDLQGDVAQRTFTGTVSKYENISGILETLELTNVLHFEIKGNQLIVRPK